MFAVKVYSNVSKSGSASETKHHERKNSKIKIKNSSFFLFLNCKNVGVVSLTFEFRKNTVSCTCEASLFAFFVSKNEISYFSYYRVEMKFQSFYFFYKITKSVQKHHSCYSMFHFCEPAEFGHLKCGTGKRMRGREEDFRNKGVGVSEPGDSGEIC